MNIRNYILFFVFTLVCANANAQVEIRSHQLIDNKMVFNPAFTGASEAFHISGSYLSNWSGNIDGSPVNQILNLSVPLNENRIALGTNLIMGRMGASQFWEVSLSYAYRLKFKEVVLSLGLNTSTSSYGINYSDLRANSPNDPGIPMNDPQTYMTNYGVGISWFAQNWFVGVSIPKLLDRSSRLEEKNLMNIANQNYQTFYLTAGGIFTLTNKIKFGTSFISEYGIYSNLQISSHFSFIFFNRLWTGVTHHTEGSVEANVKFKASKNFKFSFGQSFGLNEIRKLQDGGMRLKVEYQINPEKSISSPLSLLF